MIFSCPPYADLEKYSDNPADLSNMEYSDFVTAYRDIIQKACRKLKQNRFAVFVVGEVRGEDGEYYNFVGDTIRAFLDAGLKYYNEFCLETAVGTGALRANGTFNRGRKIVKCQQNVLCFYKGEISKIKDVFPPIDVSETLVQSITDDGE
jgi:hypothetical protein